MNSCFFFNDTATTEIYPLSLHDALPISGLRRLRRDVPRRHLRRLTRCGRGPVRDRQPGDQPPPGRPFHEAVDRSEEHTSELQSRQYLVCRLLLEKKKQAQVLAKQLNIRL